jgi:hypothetical protein
LSAFETVSAIGRLGSATGCLTIASCDILGTLSYVQARPEISYKSVGVDGNKSFSEWHQKLLGLIGYNSL